MKIFLTIPRIRLLRTPAPTSQLLRRQAASVCEHFFYSYFVPNNFVCMNSSSLHSFFLQCAKFVYKLNPKRQGPLLPNAYSKNWVEPFSKPQPLATCCPCSHLRFSLSFPPLRAASEVTFSIRLSFLGSTIDLFRLPNWCHVCFLVAYLSHRFPTYSPPLSVPFPGSLTGHRLTLLTQLLLAFCLMGPPPPVGFGSELLFVVCLIRCTGTFSALASFMSINCSPKHGL